MVVVLARCVAAVVSVQLGTGGSVEFRAQGVLPGPGTHFI